MNRNIRTLIVVLIALVAATAASYGVYRAIEAKPIREVEVASVNVVAAARPIPTGARVTAADLKLVAWPQRAVVPGSFTQIEAVVNRGVLNQVLENEPVTETKLVPLEGGVGLAPTIPQGMRALSVRVNEVVGVAGFVIPGTRVDVLVTMKDAGGDMTRLVIGNVQVLTAGTRYDQDKSKGGEPIPSSVVTLLLAPEDASRVVLASNEGQLMLSLRNPLDAGPTPSTPTRTATLFGQSAPAPVAAGPRPPRAPVVAHVEPPPPPAPPKKYTVDAIRGAKRTEEVIR